MPTSGPLWASPSSAPATGSTAAALAPTAVSEEEVTRAIRLGVDYLLSVKRNDNWEIERVGPDDYHYGVSCLVLYALLHVGESLDDARLKPRSDELSGAVKFVSNIEPRTTYAGSLQATVLSLLPQRPETVRLLERRKDQLVRSMWADGGHSYFLDPARRRTDTSNMTDGSNSQYALLGLWAAQDAGVAVPGAYWTVADKYWRLRAKPDGGFPYYATSGGPYSESTLSMTAAGVASLLIAGDLMEHPPKGKPREEKELEAAMAYLGAKFNPKSLNGYDLYAIERVGLASGRKYIGDIDWFAEGAASLIRRQGKDGSWSLSEFETYENRKVSTSFALLFLARGRNPVVLNKLEYGAGWNARPRDSANFTAWMSRQAERQINWQTVSMDVSPDAWREAPVLLIEGEKDPQFTPQQLAKLKRFAGEGGLIFSSADGESKEFTEAMQRYAEAIVDGKHKWRELPKDHEIYQIYQKMTGDDIPPLMGVSNGIRELWIHSPKDLGAAWQGRVHPTAVEKRAGRLSKERPWEIAANVFFYANGRGSMRSKLQTSAVVETGVRPVRTVKIGRLSYDGNWDPEPGAFDRLSRIAYNRWRTDLKFVPVDFKTLKNTPIVYMSGMGKPDVRAADRWLLRDYLRHGGILIADAVNSSKEFDAWMQEIVKELFEGDKWDVLDDRSVVYAATTSADMVDIKETSLRLNTQQEVGAQTKPRIYALISKVDPRVRIFYSPYDVTLGYLGTTTATFNGYSPESAEMLARNLILYSDAVVRGTKKK